jgi:hypothetical protein
MLKTNRHIMEAFSWILDVNYFIWCACKRKKRFKTKYDAEDYINFKKFSKPVAPYKCNICGGYHVGTNFVNGKNSVKLNGGNYKLNLKTKDWDRVTDRVKELQKKHVRFRIRKYNKPVHQVGTFYVYEKIKN